MKMKIRIKVKMSRVHFFDNKVMLSTEDLVFKERPAKKLVD